MGSRRWRVRGSRLSLCGVTSHVQVVLSVSKAQQSARGQQEEGCCSFSRSPSLRSNHASRSRRGKVGRNYFLYAQASICVDDGCRPTVGIDNE
jgi:hypothetical protein